MKLYHATYLANLDSIMEHGLGAFQRKNWEISEDGGVCFADDMDLAVSFCESAEDVVEEIYESGIVVLEVDSDCLLDALLFLDPNWKDEENPDACFLYRGVVRAADLKIIYDENIIDNVSGKSFLETLNDAETRSAGTNGGACSSREHGLYL